MAAAGDHPRTTTTVTAPEPADLPQAARQPLLANAARAHRALEAGAHIGKILLVP